MRSILLAIVMVFILTTQTLAWLSPNFKLSETNSIFVTLVDDAKGGCWTSLRETREYAEEKLRSKGGIIVSETLTGPYDYEFQIHVVSHRNRSGNCAGAVFLGLAKLSIDRNNVGKDIAHLSYPTSNLQVFSGYPKANNLVLDNVKEFIDMIN